MSSDRFAVYFPELNKECTSQSGYLWVGGLGFGVQGEVDVVLSVADGKLYARKKTAWLSPAGKDFHFREAHFHREHSRVPEIMSHAECKVFKNDVYRGTTFKSLVMISKFCNGGNLAEFQEKFPSIAQPLTESVLWDLFAAHVETVWFFHRGEPPLGVLDSHHQNIFLDFPEETSHIPTFFIGDLGMLRPMDANPPPGRAAPLYEDMRKVLWNVLVTSRLLSSSEDPETIVDGETLTETAADYFGVPRRGRRWSNSFTTAVRLLTAIMRDSRTESLNLDAAYEKLELLKDMVVAAAQESRANEGEEVDFSWARNDWPGPELWDDKDQLLSFCKVNRIPGPFQVAQIDPESFEILDLDANEYGILNPKPVEMQDKNHPFHSQPDGAQQLVEDLLDSYHGDELLEVESNQSGSLRSPTSNTRLPRPAVRAPTQPLRLHGNIVQNQESLEALLRDLQPPSPGNINPLNMRKRERVRLHGSTLLTGDSFADLLRDLQSPLRLHGNTLQTADSLAALLGDLQTPSPQVTPLVKMKGKVTKRRNRVVKAKRVKA